MSKPLADRVALVTGASRGIGRAIAVQLARLGAHVYVNFSSNGVAAEEAVKACHEAGGTADLIGFDVADGAAVERAIDSIKEHRKRLDILVNNAGISKDGLLIRFKDEDWKRVMDVNLNGAFYCSRAAAKIMMKARTGRIINVGSVVGEMGNAGQCAYVSSKAALIGLTKSMAKELGSRAITVNVVTPGFIETEMTAGLDPALQQEYLKGIPLGRFGTADEVAAVVAFLAQDSAAYLTGQVLGINGGLYM
jgi:3-oxoacyl-[acyl-carrier protein] reductase